MDLLCTSGRVEEDLESRVGDVGPALPLSLVVREWVPVPAWTEIRSFVTNGQLNCMTQYFASPEDHSLILAEHRETYSHIIQTFFAKTVGPVLRRLGFAEAIVDFALVPMVVLQADAVADLAHDYKPIVLELNPFYFSADCSLFDRGSESDFAIMLEGPFEYRIVECDADTGADQVSKGQIAKGKAKAKAANSTGGGTASSGMRQFREEQKRRLQAEGPNCQWRVLE